MKIKPFGVEEWMNRYEDYATYNIAETCVNSVTLNELFGLTGTDKDEFFDEFMNKRLTYGYIEGNPVFREGICTLYRTVRPEHVITMHGAAGANHHVFYSLVEPGDEVISIMPTYQQLYSIPEAFGADVKTVKLKKENGYLPDLDEIASLITDKTRMICINNPNNPTGALMDEELLKKIVSLAEPKGIYVMCDEVYRHLTQDDVYSPSIADIYDKGISTGSMSKVFSLAGLRLGWIVSKDEEFLRSCWSHRDYNHVSCGMFDEKIAGLALEHSDAILERNRAIIKDNLSVLDEWIGKNTHFSYVKPQAGTTALVYYDFDVPSEDFCRDLFEKTGSFVVPGECFEEEKCFRIGYACSNEELKAGLDAITRYCEAL